MLTPNSFPDCTDKSYDCPVRAAQGACYSASTWEEWNAILEECPDSCHQCSCGDNHDSCKLWAEGGSCDSNPGWFHVQCRESCNICSKSRYSACKLAMCFIFDYLLSTVTKVSKRRHKYLHFATISFQVHY